MTVGYYSPGATRSILRRPRAQKFIIPWSWCPRLSCSLFRATGKDRARSCTGGPPESLRPAIPAFLERCWKSTARVCRMAAFRPTASGHRRPVGRDPVFRQCCRIHASEPGERACAERHCGGTRRLSTPELPSAVRAMQSLSECSELCGHEAPSCGLVAASRGAGGPVCIPQSAGTFTPQGRLTTRPEFHTATLLTNGKVLVTGGGSDSGDLATAELYDPVGGTFATTRSMIVAGLIIRRLCLPTAGS